MLVLNDIRGIVKNMEDAEELMMDTFALPDSYMELIEESDLLSDIVKLEDNK